MQDITNDTNDNLDERQPDTPKTKNQNQRSPKRNRCGGNENINPSTNTITPGKSHKKINYTSVNRRLCTRIDDDTSLNNNLYNFQHENMTRITLKLTVPASKDPTNSTILKNLFSSDNTAALIPWYNSDKQEGSLSTKSSPLSTIKQAKIYFNKLWNINPGENYLYTQISILAT